MLVEPPIRARNAVRENVVLIALIPPDEGTVVLTEFSQISRHEVLASMN
jgi:hypothetical protein